MAMGKELPLCAFAGRGACFGRTADGGCMVLSGTPRARADGDCAFRKPRRDVTGGKSYPFDADYGKRGGQLEGGTPDARG